MDKFAEFSPSIHSRDEEDYDWLESDEDWSRCLLIPNPNLGGQDIEVETRGEFILYFAGSHVHYENYNDGYQALQEDISDIIKGKTCAYSCMYDDWAWSRGMTSVQPSEEGVKEFLRDDDEYFIRMLAEYTEKDLREDGIISKFSLGEGRPDFVGDGVGHHYGFAYVVADAVVGNQTVDTGLVEAFPHGVAHS